MLKLLNQNAVEMSRKKLYLFFSGAIFPNQQICIPFQDNHLGDCRRPETGLPWT